MKLILFAGCLLVASISAQPIPPVAPPGYDKKEGELYSWYLGRYANARFQLAEDSLNPLRTVIIGRIGFRLDARNYNSVFNAQGRKWTNVMIQMSTCSIGKMTTKWSTNNLTKPQVVFNAAYSWPLQKGTPATRPAPWDQKLSFPLKGTFIYIHNGSNDLLVDYQFRGGTMANNARWGTSTTGNFPSYSYYLDGPQTNSNQPTFLQAKPSYHGNQTCTDPAHTVGGLMLLDIDRKQYQP